MVGTVAECTGNRGLKCTRETRHEEHTQVWGASSSNLRNTRGRAEHGRLNGRDTPQGTHTNLGALEQRAEECTHEVVGYKALREQGSGMSERRLIRLSGETVKRSEIGWRDALRRAR